MFATMRVEPAYRKLAFEIEARILDRSLRDGETLPTEAELCAQFGVNRSTVREALREMESAGLVTRRRGTKRLVVTRPGAVRIADTVGRALALEDVTVLEVWESLHLVAAPAAAHGARRRTAADLAAIEAAFQRFTDDSADTTRALVHMQAFFRAVIRASGNRVLMLTLEPLLRLMEPTLAAMLQAAPQARVRVRTAQRRIADAIHARDVETARTWMSRYLRDFRRGYEVAGVALDQRVLWRASTRQTGATLPV
ncbi:MAG: FadR/GntR family transcriptional regulator [Gammaproteobacteria bacterium]